MSTTLTITEGSTSLTLSNPTVTLTWVEGAPGPTGATGATGATGPAGADGPITTPIITHTTATLTLTTAHSIIFADASSNSITFTLPTAVGIDGREYTIKRIDSSANTVTLDGDGTETIDGSLTQIIATQYDAIKVVSDGANWSII